MILQVVKGFLLKPHLEYLTELQPHPLQHICKQHICKQIIMLDGYIFYEVK